MSNPYQAGKDAYGRNQNIPKYSGYEDQKRAEAGWWHAKQGK